MAHIEKTVFVSYRRTNFYTALAVYQDLTAHGYDVFFDYQSIDSGNFENSIIENIRARAHFLVVLSPSALERCSQPGDWLRREIETAMDEKRNIVPLMMEGFDFGSTAISQALSGKLASLKTYNGLRLYADYFFDGMEKLRARYLSVALDDLNAHVLSDETKEANEVNKTIANEATQVEVTQLTAEEWFERAYVYDEAKNTDEAIRCYTKAIELNPSYAIAYANLGHLFEDLKRYEEAEDAYCKAIVADPNNAFFHTLLGGLLAELGRYPESEDVYRKAVAIDPYDAYSHTLFGNLLTELERFSEAEDEYHKAVAASPNYTYAYYSLGNLLMELDRFSEAEDVYRKAIELNPTYIYAYKSLLRLLRFNLKDRSEESLILLEKIIEINSEDFSVYLASVSISKQLGKDIPLNHKEKTRQLIPENDFYNKACLESVCDNFDLAFENLQRAAQKEKFDPAWAWDDPDLQWIQDDPRFVEIVGPKPEK